jgi:hypothetical protein
MRRAIVAFMVVAGMTLMMVGCGQEAPPPKPKGGTPSATTVRPPAPPSHGVPAPPTE